MLRRLDTWRSLSALKWVPDAASAWLALCAAGACRDAAASSTAGTAIDLAGAARTVDLSNLPAIERFQGRDGTGSASVTTPPNGAAAGRARRCVIHGSSGSSGGTHPRAVARPWPRAA